MFFAVLHGPTAVKGFIDMLGSGVLKALMVVGGMLPALGISMNLMCITRPGTVAYFLLGFFLVVYLKIDIVGVGAFAAVLASLMIQATSMKGGIQNG